MAYVVQCEKCGDNFTKFSMKSTEGRCEACRPRRSNRHKQHADAVTRVMTRIEQLEEWKETREIDMEMWQDALKAELLGKLGDIVEEMLPTAMGPQIKSMEERFMGKLATVNSRLMAINPESTLLEQMQEMEASIDRKLRVLQNLAEEVNVAQEKIEQAPKPFRRSMRQISDSMCDTLCDDAIEYMFDRRKEQRWFKRKELLDGVWNTVNPLAASELLKRMILTKQLVTKPKADGSIPRRGATLKGLHPDLLARMEAYGKAGSL